MKNLNTEFANRNLLTYNTFKAEFIKNNVSRECWSRSLKFQSIKDLYFFQDKENQKYAKLENVFQTYIINEVDLNKDGSCKKDCPAYSETKVHGCYDKGICARQVTCDGNLWGCQDQIAPIVTVCSPVNLLLFLYNPYENRQLLH